MTLLPCVTHPAPCSTETGAVFAIDMGGTNFRCYYAQLGEKPGEVVSGSVGI